MAETDDVAALVKRALGQAGWCRNNGWTQQAYLLEELAAALTRLSEAQSRLEQVLSDQSRRAYDAEARAEKAEAEAARLSETEREQDKPDRVSSTETTTLPTVVVKLRRERDEAEARAEKAEAEAAHNWHYTNYRRRRMNEIRERAQTLADTLILEREVNGQSVQFTEWAAMMIERALLAERLAERERCAQVAEESNSWPAEGEEIARPHRVYSP